MLISIFAAIGSQNLGDELILKNEIKLLAEEYGEDTEFIVFTYDIKSNFFDSPNVRYVEYFPISMSKKGNKKRNLKNFWSFIKIVRKSDLIVLGGGGIIYDYEHQLNKSPLDLWLLRIKIFNFFCKKYIFFRVGINIKNDENKGKVKKIFRKAHRIEVRDEHSHNYLLELGINSTVKPDPVFYDRGELIHKKSLVKIMSSYDANLSEIKNLDLKNKKIGIAFRSGYFIQQSKGSDQMEKKQIEELVDYILTENSEVILLPHSFHKEDMKANDYEFLKKFANKEGVTLKHSMEEVYETYKNKEIDFCFAMRLHSIILCHVYEIPFVGISYSKKTDEILYSLDVKA